MPDLNPDSPDFNADLSDFPFVVSDLVGTDALPGVSLSELDVVTGIVEGAAPAVMSGGEDTDCICTQDEGMSCRR